MENFNHLFQAPRKIKLSGLIAVLNLPSVFRTVENTVSPTWYKKVRSLYWSSWNMCQERSALRTNAKFSKTREHANISNTIFLRFLAPKPDAMKQTVRHLKNNLQCYYNLGMCTVWDWLNGYSVNHKERNQWLEKRQQKRPETVPCRKTFAKKWACTETSRCLSATIYFHWLPVLRQFRFHFKFEHFCGIVTYFSQK